MKIVTSGAGSLGGTSSTHKIPEDSMPSHAHGIIATQGVADGGGNYKLLKPFYPQAPWTRVATDGTTNTGGSQPYYPYYYGTYVWHRTA